MQHGGVQTLILILTGFSLMTFINLTMGENYYIVPLRPTLRGKATIKQVFNATMGVKLLCNTGKATSIRTELPKKYIK